MRRTLSTAAALRFAVPFGVVGLWLGLAGEAAAQSGKITGTVTEAGTNEPLIGVNVQIEGTTLGATTDLDGQYTIIGVRPGTYTVVGSYVGYQQTRVNGVRVSIDLTTQVSFGMRTEDLEGAEVVVTGETPTIQRDVTATTAIVGTQEIQALPVENLGDVVALQAGVVNGRFRGGRGGEVGYWVDGLPVSDAFNGGLGVQVETATVQELQVVTGAFNAEYGQALSGIVNIVTKDGDNRFAGSAETFVGDYLSSDERVFQGIDQLSPFAVRNAELNVSGPVVKDRLWFFASGRVFGNDGFLQGRRVFLPGDVDFNPAGSLALVNPSGSGDSTLVPFNPYEKTSGQFKLTYRLNRDMRLAANVLASRENSRGADYSLLFAPDNRLFNRSDGLAAYLKFTHTLSNRTFYEVGVTRNHTAYRQRLFDDPLDPGYAAQGVDTSPLTSSFSAGGANTSRFSRSTTTWLAKADLTSQLHRYHLVKTGVELRRHDLAFNDDYTVVNTTGTTVTVDSVGTGGRYAYQPVEASAYVQDKIEAGGLIVNVGLRLDYFHSNGLVFRDPTSLDAVVNRPAAVRAGTDPECTTYTCAKYFTTARPKLQLSPRLGIAFPVTEGGVVHFSYGWFFQTPNFQYLYQNPYFQLGAGGSGLVGFVGNADLEPEQTISYEIGMKQALAQGTTVELTAYARDIRNLTGTDTAPIQLEGSSIRYGRLVNSDFGAVRGVILRYDQRLGRRAFLGADYTFQIARANASDPAEAYNAAAARGVRETKIVPTSWDQRHTLNATAGYDVPGNWGFGLVGRFGSGSPYTPSVTTVQSGTQQTSVIRVNALTKPAVFSLDLDANKQVRLGRVHGAVFGRVTNLLDRRNEYGVYSETGRASYSLQKAVDAKTFRGETGFLDRWYANPYFYDEPRRVTLGLRVSF